MKNNNNIKNESISKPNPKSQKPMLYIDNSGRIMDLNTEKKDEILDFKNMNINDYMEHDIVISNLPLKKEKLAQGLNHGPTQTTSMTFSKFLYDTDSQISRFRENVLKENNSYQELKIEKETESKAMEEILGKLQKIYTALNEIENSESTPNIIEQRQVTSQENIKPLSPQLHDALAKIKKTATLDYSIKPSIAPSIKTFIGITAKTTNDLFDTTKQLEEQIEKRQSLSEEFAKTKDKQDPKIIEEIKENNKKITQTTLNLLEEEKHLTELALPPQKFSFLKKFRKICKSISNVIQNIVKKIFKGRTIDKDIESPDQEGFKMQINPIHRDETIEKLNSLRNKMAQNKAGKLDKNLKKPTNNQRFAEKVKNQQKRRQSNKSRSR